jgi:phosphoribosylanthranilate isomerase
MTKVKICGITSLRDAWTAIDAGADALGFVFYAKSPRRATALEARAIIRTLPPLVTTFGVFVNESAEVINETAGFCRLSMAQLHGDEKPSILGEIKVPVMRAINVRTARDAANAAEWRVPLYLFDAYSPAGPGGTGKRLPLAALKSAPAGVPYFLAGGLNPDNVAAAIRKVRPFGVDASSGLESAPGWKDAAKVRRFVRAAKLA